MKTQLTHGLVRLASRLFKRDSCSWTRDLLFSEGYSTVLSEKHIHSINDIFLDSRS